MDYLHYRRVAAFREAAACGRISEAALNEGKITCEF